MKKLSLILSVFLLSAISANAYVDSQYTATEQFLVNEGYSAEAARVNSIISKDPYRENEKTETTFWRRINWYLNPSAHRDYTFYNYSTDFDRTWWTDI